MGIQIWPSGSKDKEQLSDAKRFASAARDSLLSRDLPHAAGAFDLFLGGLPQQTVASVDHRETPQQFDRWQPLISIRDLLIHEAWLGASTAWMGRAEADRERRLGRRLALARCHVSSNCK